jgi:hypothetical protein
LKGDASQKILGFAKKTRQMILKTALLIGILLVCSAFCFGQKAAGKTGDKTGDTERQRIKLAKQSAIDNFEVEIQSISYPEIRSFVRYQVAAYLWKDGKDDTGYAVRSAVKAVEELLEDEKVCSGTCQKILVLLDLHSPETKNRLVEKYKIDSITELDSTLFIPDGKNSEKAIADKLVKIFDTDSETSFQIPLFIQGLASTNSPELPRVLDSLLRAEERGRVNYSADTLWGVADAFRSSVVPEALRSRFYLLAIRKGFAALSSDGEDITSAYNLINVISEDVPRSNESLFNQVNLLKISLGAGEAEENGEFREVYERIEKSDDKLAATLSEADAAENKDLKRELYQSAYGLALEAKKLQIALDVLAKLVELYKADNKDKKNENGFFERLCDQSYTEVALLALKIDDLKINEVAAGKINDNLARAAVLKKRALYLFDKKRINAASEELKESIKIASEADFRPKKIFTLLQLIPVVQKIDKSQTFNVTFAAAKAINSFSPPDEKDMADRSRYTTYMTTALEIDVNLLAAFRELLKANKNDAVDLSNRINRKELKIAVGQALLEEQLEALQVKKR